MKKMVEVGGVNRRIFPATHTLGSSIPLSPLIETDVIRAISQGNRRIGGGLDSVFFFRRGIDLEDLCRENCGFCMGLWNEVS
jgi:hypothetical protein